MRAFLRHTTLALSAILLASSINTSFASCVNDGVVTTIAGTAGQSGYVNATGAAARFNSPYAITTSPSGNLYVVDGTNRLIRQISPTGVVTTLAGGGAGNGTDGTGTAASFNSPTRIVADLSGNLYVTESSNGNIRKVTPAGVVTTYASGLGIANGITRDSAGNLYVGSFNGSVIFKVTPAGVVSTFAGAAGYQGFADGTGAAARFSNLAGLTIDSAGNIYGADQSNSAIRKITPAGVVTTLAGGTTGAVDGTGSAARFYLPLDVTVDSANNVYVADTQNNNIRKVTPAGVVTTLAGPVGGGGAVSIDGTRAAAAFSHPTGIAVNAAGDVFVVDYQSNVIRKIQ